MRSLVQLSLLAQASGLNFCQP
uniref:Uncharacterized protein n=1 Tax=Rhodnius prolixus TaxID=13249 RepID=T1HPP0_RHOPR